MEDIRTRFNNKIRKLFKDISNYSIIDDDYKYVEYLFDLDENINIDHIINFINTYEDSIINNLLNNERFKDKVLKKDNIIYRNKENSITRDFIKNIIDNIKNKKFDKDSICVIMEVISIINLYGINNKEIKNILNNNINIIVENVNLVSDGDINLDKDEKNKKSDILIKWSKVAGNDIIEQIFNLELLKERLYDLLNTEKIDISMYSEKILDMINTCDKAIELRDNDIILPNNIINKINRLFIDYEAINHKLFINLLNNNDYKLIHFIQSEEVNYQLINNKVIDVNKHKETEEYGYNQKQNNIFISSYLKYAKTEIEKIKEEKFDVNNLEHRNILQYYLNIFNYNFNNNPLYRFPIEMKEVGNNYDTYIRLSDNRLSCSLNSFDYTNSHLGRNIGLIVRPKDEKSIISMSSGYTSKKYFYDFRNDSVTCNSLINRLLSNPKNVSEIVLDSSKCIVEGVILIGDNENDIIRANKLAGLYGVPVIKYDNTKIR